MSFSDAFLRGDRFRFSVDEIFPLFDKEKTFNVRVIPDVNSKYFAPYHLRNIRVSAELLEKNFYDSFALKLSELESAENRQFSGDVAQGKFYDIPISELPKTVFKEDTIITRKNNIFKYRGDLPYTGEENHAKNIVDLSTLEIKPRRELKAVYLYCFNVGQGDAFLLITSNGNVFLIDLNIYSDDQRFEYVGSVKKILRSHRLSGKHIDGLIITHKHLDHLRGADVFVNSGTFDIKRFFINLDYSHPTLPVQRLFEAAKSKIPIWCNVNKQGRVVLGNTYIDIMNPTRATSTNNNVPDINDSSIYLFVTYDGKCCAHLTGDIGYHLLNENQPELWTRINCMKFNALLKVSHHGSRTGTNSETIKNLFPTHAFISAGTSRKYRHPHEETLNILNGVDLKISKVEKCTMQYKIDEQGMHFPQISGHTERLGYNITL